MLVGFGNGTSFATFLLPLQFIDERLVQISTVLAPAKIALVH